MKFITYTNLTQWADTKDCQTMLPELIRKLIRASVHTINRLTIPSGDAVNLPGWDGIVETPERINTIGEGLSLWEMGVNEGVKGKIDDDFNKRDVETGGFDKTLATFVFITPRTWTGATKWVEEKKNKSIWKNIIVYTAVELEDWIEQHPAVGLWLANHLGIVSDSKIELIDNFWNRWARGKDVTLRYDLLLGGRTEAINEIIATVTNPSITYIEALSKQEAQAFIIAALMSIGEGHPEILDRCLIVNDAETLLQMSKIYEHLIFVITAVDISHNVVMKGHSVICAVSPADEVATAVKLPIVERDAFISSLEASGFERNMARQLALDTARNVMALRRRQEIDATLPEWAYPYTLRPLIPAILAGRWNGNADGDKELLEELFNTTYANIEQRLREYLLMNDSPFIEVDGSLRTISPYEAIGYVIPLLTNEDKNRLSNAFKKAMTDDDPDAVEKIQCAELRFWQNKQKISRQLKKGLCQTLILLTIHDAKLKGFVDNMVAEVLKDFTLQRYLSNRHIFVLLAEASPDSVLNFIENDIKNGCPLQNELFIVRNDPIGIVGTSIYYTELLFALEEIAWDENFLLRCVMILLKLCEYPNDSNYVNKPINSLRHILRFILPQTYATDSQRDKVMSAVIKRIPEGSSILILKLLQDLSGEVFENTAHYRWRLYDKQCDPKYIIPVHPDRVINVCQIMLDSIEPNAENISELIKLSFNSNMECIRGMILKYINGYKCSLKGEGFVCNTLREKLDHQISCEGMQWALTADELKPYQNLLDELMSDDVLEKNKWLFEDSYVRIPYNRKNSEKKNYDVETEYRRNAIREIYTYGGFDAILKFVKIIKCPRILGNSYAQEVGEDNMDEVIWNYINDGLSDDFIMGYLQVLYNKNGSEWFIKKIEGVNSVEKLISLLCALMYNKEIAEYVETLSQNVQKKYWKMVKLWGYTPGDAMSLIDKMLSVNRADVALEIIHHIKHEVQINDKLKFECLSQLLTTSAGQFKRADMILYITDLVKELDRSEDPEVMEKLPQVELLLYPILEHRVDVGKLRLMSAILHQPSLLMELIEMAYSPEDEEEREKVIQKFEEDANRKVFAKMAFQILYNLHGVPCFGENVNVDENAFNAYVDELLELAKKNKRLTMTYYTIGHLLGNIPENDNYPPEYLSDIIERLDNDHVDNSYNTRLFNKRGVTTRAYNAGGAIEWAYVDRYKSYGNRTRFSHPRITRIFDSLTAQYEDMAKRKDAEAKLIDLDN